MAMAMGQSSKQQKANHGNCRRPPPMDDGIVVSAAVLEKLSADEFILQRLN
jgi:hypothetical protein